MNGINSKFLLPVMSKSMATYNKAFVVGLQVMTTSAFTTNKQMDLCWHERVLGRAHAFATTHGNRQCQYW